MSVLVANHPTTLPSASSCGTTRMRNHRYSPSYRRMRVSSSPGLRAPNKASHSRTSRSTSLFRYSLDPSGKHRRATLAGVTVVAVPFRKLTIAAPSLAAPVYPCSCMVEVPSALRSDAGDRRGTDLGSPRGIPAAPQHCKSGDCSNWPLATRVNQRVVRKRFYEMRRVTVAATPGTADVLNDTQKTVSELAHAVILWRVPWAKKMW